MKQILLFFLVNLPLLVFSQFQETFDSLIFLFWYFRSFRRRLNLRNYPNHGLAIVNSL